MCAWAHEHGVSSLSLRPLLCSRDKVVNTIRRTRYNGRVTKCVSITICNVKCSLNGALCVEKPSLNLCTGPQTYNVTPQLKCTYIRVCLYVLNHELFWKEGLFQVCINASYCPWVVLTGFLLGGGGDFPVGDCSVGDVSIVVCVGVRVAVFMSLFVWVSLCLRMFACIEVMLYVDVV